MKVEQWINLVGEVLDKHRPVDGGLYVLCWVDGKLALRKKRGLGIKWHPLLTLTSQEINQGLTSSRWYSVGCKLATQKALNPELK